MLELYLCIKLFNCIICCVMVMFDGVVYYECVMCLLGDLEEFEGSMS